jgi:hypothetical protein
MALAKALRGRTLSAKPMPALVSGKPLYLGHPEFEGFTVLQEVKADSGAGVAAE